MLSIEKKKERNVMTVDEFKLPDGITNDGMKSNSIKLKRFGRIKIKYD